MRDGSYSIILGEGYYGEFILNNNMNINPLVLTNTIVEEENNINLKKTDNKLIKITYDNPYHNNTIEDILRKSKNWNLIFLFRIKKI